MTPWPAAHQAPPSMGLSRREYWSGAPLAAEAVTKAAAAVAVVTAAAAGAREGSAAPALEAGSEQRRSEPRR